MKRLRRVNASMGLMLETTARIPAHNGSTGKAPEVRLAMMEDAGKLKIPFTTGLLLGIGETVADREESLVAIRDLHRKYGHIQEIILQNFCPKDDTPMAAFRCRRQMKSATRSGWRGTSCPRISPSRSPRTLSMRPGSSGAGSTIWGESPRSLSIT